MHCAASCNDTAICTALVQHGAAIFATTLSDGATAIEKCDPYREGYADCATYLAGARRGGGPAAKESGRGKQTDCGSRERMPGEVRGCTDLDGITAEGPAGGTTRGGGGRGLPPGRCEKGV